VDGAAKALLKATELDPDNTAGIQRLTKDLKALRQKAAAAAAAAAGRRGSTAAGGSTGSSSSDDEGPSGSNGQQEKQEKQQQPRQRQQQRWDRPGYRHGVKSEEVQDILEDYWLAERSNGVVGWCLAFLDLLFYWWMRAAAMTAEWSDSECCVCVEMKGCKGSVCVALPPPPLSSSALPSSLKVGSEAQGYGGG